MSAEGAMRFGAIILSARRAELAESNTVAHLRKHGYTGEIHLVIGEDDPTKDEYVKRFGSEHVHTFEKDDDAQDLMQRVDDDSSRGVVVYARNAVDGIAGKIGLTHYVVLDDDYDIFMYRPVRWDEEEGKLKLGYVYTTNLDEVFAAMCEFLEDTGALTVAMAQGGDVIGGAENTRIAQGLLRKAMNSFVVKTGNAPSFSGWLNEDVNMYLDHGARGDLVFTLMDVHLHQPQTQKNAGGLTEEYRHLGTYVKSFYSLMIAPSCVTIRPMGGGSGAVYLRPHHGIQWRYAVPKILSEKWRKPR